MKLNCLMSIVRSSVGIFTIPGQFPPFGVNPTEEAPMSPIIQKEACKSMIALSVLMSHSTFQNQRSILTTVEDLEQFGNLAVAF